MKKIIYPSTKVERNVPKNLKNNHLLLFSHEIKKTISESYIFKKKNIYYFNSIIISLIFPNYFNKYTFFGDKTFIERMKRIVKSFLYSDKKIEHIDKGIWFTDHKSHVYFHWILDSLQRAEMSINFNDEFPFLVPEELFKISFVNESLDFLGLRYKVLKSDQLYKIDNLLITSKTADESGNYNTVILNKLIKRFKENTKFIEVKPSKNYFIIRQQKDGRIVDNFESLKKVLNKYNFELLRFEEYTFHEKINLMNECKNLMGIFGSGLTNMIFLNQESNVIEIREKEDRHNNAFFSLSSSAGLNYYYEFFEFNDKGLFVDPAGLDKLLKSLK